MTGIIAEQSMSLDGFSAGTNITLGNPMGDGGEQLHEWMFRAEGASDDDSSIRREMFDSSGAVITGRRTFDLGVGPWGDDPPFRMPVLVVTHRAEGRVVRSGGTTYDFVTEGIESALDRARAAAGERDVAILGGADLIRQFLSAGLVDELRIHVVHVLLGDGIRLFERTDDHRIELECTRLVGSSGVTHLTFRVANRR